MAHYFDGEWKDEQDMKISVFDITLLRGYGAFEFLRTYNKKPFMMGNTVITFFLIKQRNMLID
jgi:branched-subunit amino acid aminotransferase/4-amino-4-deoxychorismate lyase